MESLKLNNIEFFSHKNTCAGYYPYGKLINELSYNTNNSFTNSYQNKELLEKLGLHDFHARYYDSELGRWFNVDPALQMNSPYLAMGNNPVVYVDPDGEWFFTALAIIGTTLLFTTDAGYELQKYVSPVAFQIDIGFGSHEQKLGFNVSWGIPKVSPYAKRWDYGKTYYWKHINGDYTGWETRKGSETSYFGLYHEGETKYTAGEFSQTVGFKKFGIPSIAGIDVYNDMWGDGGDRYRTSKVVLNLFPIRVKSELITGDPGLLEEDRYKERIEKCGNNLTYAKKPNDPYAPDPNSHRAGILSIGIGPISIGYDSEPIRYFFQNIITHNITGSPYFRYDRNKKSRFYFDLWDW